MERVELSQLFLDKSLSAKRALSYFLAVGIRKYEAAQYKEERYATLTAKVERLADDVRHHYKHDEYKPQRLDGTYQLFNSSTLQFFNSSILQLFNSSIFLHVRVCAKYGLCQSFGFFS